MFKFLRSTALWILLLPYVCTFTGAASNQLVLNANGDTFPVRINLVKLHKWSAEAITTPDGTVFMDETHIVMTSHTRFNWLADIFDFHDNIQSIGDMLIDFGAWLGTFCKYAWLAVVVDRWRRP